MRNDAGYFIKARKAVIDKPFALHVALRRQNMRQDMDNRSKAILDCFQHYGIIKNDNLCEGLTMCWDSDLPAECVVIIQICEGGWRRDGFAQAGAAAFVLPKGCNGGP